MIDYLFMTIVVILMCLSFFIILIVLINKRLDIHTDIFIKQYEINLMIKKELEELKRKEEC